MITKREKLDSYKERVHDYLSARIQKVAEVTQQEVSETLGKDNEIELNGEIAEDVLITEFEDDPTAFINFCGFSPDEFDHLYGISGNIFIWKGRGRKPNVSSKDTLFLLLHYLKRYPKFEDMEQGVSISVATLERLFKRAIPAAAEYFFKKFVQNYATDGDLPIDQNFPATTYILDATAQRIYTPTGSFEEKKKFYSGKHGFYCLKSQVITDMKGAAVHVVTNIPGATHDFEIFKNSVEEFKLIMVLHSNRPQKILADKGYISEDYNDILVTPHKGKAYTLSKSQLADNQIIGKTRVLVENFFGRMKNRYAIIGSLYRGDRENYENIFRLCVALTNFEIMYCKHPLRKEDGEFYAKFTTSDINEMRKKAAEKQKRNGSARRVFDSDSD